MNVVCLDMSKSDTEYFKTLCTEIPTIETVTCFGNGEALLAHLEENAVEFVFCEIDLGTQSGLGFIERIKTISPFTRVVYITKRTDMAIQAFEVGASGYIVKPYTAEKLAIPIQQYAGEKPAVEIKTFGTFDIFVNQKAVLFSNKKSKELLALLVDQCGKSLTMEQIIDVLWEDRPFNESTKSLYRIALKGLRDTLKKANCYDIIQESRGQRSLDTTKVKCDYYEYLKNPKKYVGFYGEYMTNYSWGEYTLAKICGNIF